MNNDRENRKRTTPGAGKIALLLLFLGLLADLENAGVLAIVAALALLAFGGGWLISKAIRRENGKAEMPAAQGKAIAEKRKQGRAYPRTAADEAERERRKTYSPENFDLEAYDRRKRIEQLDGFLKNGIIDREEYRRMKERYENL